MEHAKLQLLSRSNNLIYNLEPEEKKCSTTSHYFVQKGFPVKHQDNWRNNEAQWIFSFF